MRGNFMPKVLLIKLMERLREIGRDESKSAEHWAKKQSVNFSKLAFDIDKTLWFESETTSVEIKKNSSNTLNELKSKGIDLGGGGAIELTYFLTRLIKPENILETGVAAGWSTYSFLSAIEKNKKGNLYSSDLPYFRIKDPKKYIGILVPTQLRRDNWILKLDGDDINFKSFLIPGRKFQLVHWDSDKRKIARVRFLTQISAFLSENSVVVMDDIQNNLAFKEFVTSRNLAFFVIHNQDKYVGVILYGSYRDLLLE
jgi:hypothetical protein